MLKQENHQIGHATRKHGMINYKSTHPFAVSILTKETPYPTSLQETNTIFLGPYYESSRWQKEPYIPDHWRQLYKPFLWMSTLNGLQ